jgi:hypothetical protein
VIDDEYAPPTTTTRVALSSGTGSGLAGLLIGCTLLISACALMVFNVLLFIQGMRGVPRDLAQVGGVIGTAGVAFLGLCGIVFAARGWAAANRSGESSALGVAGTLTATVGLVAWLIASVDLIFILFD